jgi:hypothetical protein
VELSDKYPLKQMSAADLACVYDAFSKYLVKRAAKRAAAAAADAPADAAASAAQTGVEVGDQQPQLRPAALAGEMFDRRPAVLKEDIEHQMMTRWQVAHPKEAATLAADAQRQVRAKTQEQEASVQEDSRVAVPDGAGADDAEAVLPGSTGDVGLELGFGFEIDGPTWRPEDNLDLGLGGSSDEEEYRFEDADEEEDFTLEPFDVHSTVDDLDEHNAQDGEADA